MLLVLHWIIHRRVSEFGFTHLSRFSDITDEQLDSKIGAFLNEHGCLVGTSMLLGQLRSYSWVASRNKSTSVPLDYCLSNSARSLVIVKKSSPKNLSANCWSTVG